MIEHPRFKNGKNRHSNNRSKNAKHEIADVGLINAILPNQKTGIIQA